MSDAVLGTADGSVEIVWDPCSLLGDFQRVGRRPEGEGQGVSVGTKATSAPKGRKVA